MRCFIGLDLSASEKLALDSWRQQAMPEVLPRHMTKSMIRSNDAGTDTGIRNKNKGKTRGKKTKSAVNKGINNNEPGVPYAVPAANYHMTLCFLGDIDHRQHEALMAELDALTAEPFTLTLDETGIWNGPKILFSAPSSPPNELMNLAKLTRKSARSAGIEVEGKEYKPHITMVRKATSTLPLPLFAPSIDVQASAFHLFESVSTPQGVAYPIRDSWSLEHNISIREKLRRGITD